MGFFDKLKKINIFNTYTKLSDDFYDELEEALILSDMGMDSALKAVARLRERCEAERIGDTEKAKAVMREILADMLNVGDKRLILYSQPSIVLFIGVNGVGKTTTIGKIGNILKKEGKKVMFAAADTFRAAATEQLTIWAERCGVDIIKQGEGADPASVVFDAINAANARYTDVVLVDTAGRLHNKTNLMNELNKIDRVIKRECPICSKETLLVLDATTGQNGLTQAKQFKEACGITGIVLTKLDGTAKGGIAIAIAQELGLPVKFAGVGEGIDDLRYFDADEFVKAFI
ncbi:MAG: signal recognition particle-docking protein FtsY [Clostridiales bacterium]|nr:signal recognition particle-docking protein FtsY [Clostridiales bacterium]MCD7802335.1 signal recognition particle-docking protein FtsY [Clostridiales bacterium]MCD7881634.1 signal recognition particle-docking protein FtsY [Clostridiales bacterium]